MPRRKQEDSDDLIEEAWDKKRLFIASAFLIVIALGIGYALLEGKKYFDSTAGRVLGEFWQKSPQREEIKEIKLPTQKDINKIIEHTKEELSKITSENLTSSQAAIQKIIRDLEILQGKKDAGDYFCDLVCKEK